MRMLRAVKNCATFQNLPLSYTTPLNVLADFPALCVTYNLHF